MVDKKEKVPGWAWWTLCFFSLIIGISVWLTTKPSPPPPPVRGAVQEKKIEVTLHPGHYTEVPLPYYHWFDFGYEDDFQVKLSGVKNPFDFRVGQPRPKLDNEIPGNRLYMKSLVGKQIKVTILLRPKKETET